MISSFCRLAVFLVLSILCMGIASCSNPPDLSRQRGYSPETDNKLRVGISTNAPPLVYRKDGRIQGLEIDFAHQLGDYLGKKVQFVERPWDQQIPSLEKNEIDIIMAGMSVTPKRAYRVSFSDPYLQSGQIMLVRTKNARRFSEGIFSLMGANYLIGTVQDTTGDYFVTKTINRARTKKFSTSLKAVKALIADEIDVFIYDAPMVCHYASIYETEKLTPIVNLLTGENLAWAVNKNNPELLEHVNHFLTINRENNNLKKTIRRWLPYL